MPFPSKIINRYQNSFEKKTNEEIKRFGKFKNHVSLVWIQNQKTYAIVYLYLQSLWHQAISSRITTNSFHFLDIKFPEWRMEIKEFKTKMIFQRFCYLFIIIYIIFFLNWQWVEHDFTIYRVLWFSFPASLFMAFRNLFPYDVQTLKTYYSANCYSTAQYSIHQETINFHAWHFSCIVLTG